MGWRRSSGGSTSSCAPGERPRFDWTLIELRASRFPEDPEVARVVQASLAPWRARSERVIGHAAAPLERYGVVENTADEVLADAIRAHTGTRIALSNGFRFGHPIEPGPIHERDLWMLFPVTTRLRVGTVTGAQLRRFWEDEVDHVFTRDPQRLFGGWMPRVSGMRVRFRAGLPYGERVTSIEVNGEPLDDARVYTLAACEREGEDDALCRIRGVEGARTLDIDVHETVRRYLAAHGPIGAQAGGRVIAEDLPPRVCSSTSAGSELATDRSARSRRWRRDRTLASSAGELITDRRDAGARWSQDRRRVRAALEDAGRSGEGARRASTSSRCGGRSSGACRAPASSASCSRRCQTSRSARAERKVVDAIAKAEALATTGDDETYEAARRAAMRSKRDLLIHRDALRFPRDPEFDRRYPIPPRRR